MSAPLLLILLPALTSAGLYLIGRRRRLSFIIATALALVLGLLSLILPIGNTLKMGPLSLSIDDTFYFLGRRFVVNSGDMLLGAFIYAALTYWLAFAYFLRVHWLFTPTSLGIVALLFAVLAVEPFLYAALLIELVSLISVLVLIAPSQRVSRGILRFLTFQTLGMPFILYTGWMLSGVEVGSPQAALMTRSALLLGLGFAFLLAVFPFHTWIPMVMEEANPFPAVFILFMLTLIVPLFGLSFLDRYEWLRASSTLYGVFAITGVLMALIGGTSAAFEHHLGRVFGYVILIEIGYSFLAISFAGEMGLGLFISLLIPRIVSFGIWALDLTLLRSYRGGLNFHSIRGVARDYPYVSFSLLCVHFASMGFPMLAGFSQRITLWELLAMRDIPLTIGLVFGSLGLLVAGLRVLAVLVIGPEESLQRIKEELWLRVALVIGISFLVLVGAMPQWFNAAIVGIERAFPNL